MFYSIDNAVGIVFYFFVSKSNDRNSLCFKKFRPFFVVLLGFCCIVNIAIYLYAKTYRRTIKVKNISPISMLLTEFKV